jgi:iron-sulfur cluster repair protein YtfE (RIC family)
MKTIESGAPLRGARTDNYSRANHGGDRRVSWSPAVGTQIAPLPRLRKSHVQQIGLHTGLSTDAWRRTGLADLCSSLERRDHVKLRNHLATMTYRVAAAAAIYCDSKPHVLEIDRIYAEFLRRLWVHMFREEHGIYTSIRNMDQARARPLRGSSILIDTIRASRREHRYFAKALRRIATLLRGYELPRNAGHKYRELVQGFRELEAYKLRHMENEGIVYSRALAIEQKLMDM